jgi:hypothetical protein
VLDGIEMERRGIPAAVVCTDAFEITGRAMAKTVGADDYPFLLIPHPISNLSEEQIRRRAEEVVDDVVRLVVRR